MREGARNSPTRSHEESRRSGACHRHEEHVRCIDEHKAHLPATLAISPTFPALLASSVVGPAPARAHRSTNPYPTAKRTHALFPASAPVTPKPARTRPIDVKVSIRRLRSDRTQVERDAPLSPPRPSEETEQARRNTVTTRIRTGQTKRGGVEASSDLTGEPEDDEHTALVVTAHSEPGGIPRALGQRRRGRACASAMKRAAAARSRGSRREALSTTIVSARVRTCRSSPPEGAGTRKIRENGGESSAENNLLVNAKRGVVPHAVGTRSRGLGGRARRAGSVTSHAAGGGSITYCSIPRCAMLVCAPRRVHAGSERRVPSGADRATRRYPAGMDEPGGRRWAPVRVVGVEHALVGGLGAGKELHCFACRDFRRRAVATSLSTWHSRAGCVTLPRLRAGRRRLRLEHREVAARARGHERRHGAGGAGSSSRSACQRAGLGSARQGKAARARQ